MDTDAGNNSAKTGHSIPVHSFLYDLIHIEVIRLSKEEIHPIVN